MPFLKLFSRPFIPSVFPYPKPPSSETCWPYRGAAYLPNDCLNDQANSLIHFYKRCVSMLGHLFDPSFLFWRSKDALLIKTYRHRLR